MKLEFLGVGSAFNFELGNTSILIEDSILVDCGYTVPIELKRLDKLDKITDILITHNHSDNIGGLETLGFMYYFIYKKRPRLWVFDDDIWCSLKNGMENIQSDHGAPLTASLDTYFDLFILDAIPDANCKFEISDKGIPVYCTATQHCQNMLSVSFVFNNNIVYSGDIRHYDQGLIDIAKEQGSDIKAIFYDCQLFDTGIANVHPYIGDLLKRIPKKLKSKTWFMHYGENHERWLPMVEQAGFPGFVKKGQVFDL